MDSGLEPCAAAHLATRVHSTAGSLCALAHRAVHYPADRTRLRACPTRGPCPSSRVARCTQVEFTQHHRPSGSLRQAPVICGHDLGLVRPESFQRSLRCPMNRNRALAAQVDAERPNGRTAGRPGALPAECRRVRGACICRGVGANKTKGLTRKTLVCGRDDPWPDGDQVVMLAADFENDQAAVGM